MNARLRVEFAGPYVSFQDAGRPGNLRFGVPRSGPMDRRAFLLGAGVIGLAACAKPERDLLEPYEGVDIPLNGNIEVQPFKSFYLLRGQDLTSRHGQSSVGLEPLAQSSSQT